MPLLSWDNNYSVNNKELDHHHKEMCNILNMLYEYCVQTEKVYSIVPVLQEMISLLTYHFSAEEQYMADIGYKDIVNHIHLHQAFLKRVMKLKQVENQDDCELTKDLIVLLGNWLRKHVIEEDKKYSI